jgi:hypothetical protein
VQEIQKHSNNIFIYMNEEVNIWFDDDILFDVGLDEHLCKLFKEIEELTESNVNNFFQYEYQ